MTITDTVLLFLTIAVMKPKELSSLLYMRIASAIEQQIRNRVLQVGDKVPSLRTICQEYGVSQATAIQAYHYLESRALIEARPQSGYYVSPAPVYKLAESKPSVILASSGDGSLEALVDRVYNNIGQPARSLPLSLGVPAQELLPLARLNKGLVKAMRGLDGSGVNMEHPLGNERLRKQIARWSFAMEARLDPDNIITTAGCLNAISYALMALTEPGDTIAVESPVSFGMLQVAQSLRLQVLELPADPLTGIDLDVLKKHFQKKKIKLCLFISNFSNPLGSCMPDERKKELVQLLEKYQVPLIENDLNGDVFFGHKRPKSCKTYDESGLVIWCGSVSKSLAPGYRVGWVDAGRFREKLLRMKLYHSISSTSIVQEVVADFLETGRYEAHLRKLRQTLYTNYLHYIRCIQEHFPADTRLSRPQGGFVLWVELNRRADTVDLYERAMRHKISIAPGKIFTLQKQYNNCLRLNYGLVWNEKTRKALVTLGRLAGER